MDTKTIPEPDLRVGHDAGLDGDSPPMQALRSAIARLAAVAAPVLVHGENGTGKERAARQLHLQSRHADGPFLAVHASTLRAGFFSGTGDAPDRRSLESANGGTLFIDAIEELPEEAQAALLHLLQGAVAEGTALPPSVRVVAASQRDATELAARGLLRADLLTRLGALQLPVPALRERREDLPGLAAQFLAELAGGRDLRLSDAAAAALVLHTWPGNVRELRNRLAQAALLTDGAAVSPDMLGLPAPGRPHGLSLREMRQAAEREAITRALRKSQGQVPAAAAMLGISRAQLYRLISRLRLDHHAVVDTVDRARLERPVGGNAADGAPTRQTAI